MAGCRSFLRFVPDEPVEAITVDDLAVGSSPGLGGEGIDHLSVDRKPVEPLVEDVRFRGAQQREPDALEPDAGLSWRGIRSGDGDNTGEDSVSDGVWRTVTPAEVVIRVQSELTAEDVRVEAEGLPRRAGKRDIDLWRRHAHQYMNAPLGGTVVRDRRPLHPPRLGIMWRPATLEDYLARWRLRPNGPAFSTRSSHLQPVLRGDAPAMLKVARIEEEANGCHLLAWWDGHGAARVFDVDDHAAVIEWGGASLVDLAGQDDDHATRILCDVAASLHAASARFIDRPDGLIPLDVWFRSLFENDRGGFYARAAVIARRLLDDADATVLHGDLHHGNVLDFGERGPLAIDPKFLVGKRMFDYTNILCNPSPGLAEAHFDRRVGLISEVAGIQPQSLLEWTVAWTGLSASWHAADGNTVDEENALRIGALAEQGLD